MTFRVDVVVCTDGVRDKVRVRKLVPTTLYRTLTEAKQWLGTNRQSFRAWLRADEPCFEAWVYDAAGEPAFYERCTRGGFGEGETLTRGELRKMRLEASAPTATPESPPVAKTNGHANGHALNGHANGHATNGFFTHASAKATNVTSRDRKGNTEP